MTNNKAIKVLKDMIPKTCKMVNGRYVGGFEDTECPQFEAVQVAVEALEKQIPKKPVIENNKVMFGIIYGICPACGSAVYSTANPFCNHCGQALDWSDSE